MRCRYGFPEEGTAARVHSLLNEARALAAVPGDILTKRGLAHGHRHRFRSLGRHIAAIRASSRLAAIPAVGAR